MASRAEVYAAAGIGLAGLGVLGFALLNAGSSPGPAPGPSPPGGPGPGPSCLPLTLIATGPGTVSGCGGRTRSSASVCVTPGEACQYTAMPDPGASFDHWAGPGGVTSQQNPIVLPVTQSGGFIEAVFVPGGAGQPPPSGAPPPAGLPACRTNWGAVIQAPNDGRMWVMDACGSKHLVDNGIHLNPFNVTFCFYSPFGTDVCNIDAVPTGPPVSQLNCCPGTGNQCHGC